LCAAPVPYLHPQGFEMQVDHHDLRHEFPEFSAAIDALKASNAHFARLFDEYHALTDQVEELEVKDIPVGDFTFEDLKKRRAKLKDELYTMLRTHAQ
jgi:uncharacterized protein YdcH (DUF465 family)